MTEIEAPAVEPKADQPVEQKPKEKLKLRVWLGNWTEKYATYLDGAYIGILSLSNRRLFGRLLSLGIVCERYFAKR